MTGPEQVAPSTESIDRSGWPTLTSKCHPDDLRTIDVAAALVGKPRSHFMLDAVMASAKETLAAHNVELPPAPAAQVA